MAEQSTSIAMRTFRAATHSQTETPAMARQIAGEIPAGVTSPAAVMPPAEPSRQPAKVSTKVSVTENATGLQQAEDLDRQDKDREAQAAAPLAASGRAVRLGAIVFVEAPALAEVVYPAVVGLVEDEWVAVDSAAAAGGASAGSRTCCNGGEYAK